MEPLTVQLDGLADFPARIEASACIRRQLERYKKQVWGVEDALSRAKVPVHHPGRHALTRMTLMGRIAYLADHRNRLLNRCRAAGLPTD